MAITVCCFARECRGPHESDVGKPRREDFLQNEAPVAIVSFGIFPWPRIPQNNDAAGL